MNISTPALLFPAISLLLLAYTNRFQMIGLLIREINKQESSNANHKRNKEQIVILKKRIIYIRRMQILAIISFILCIFSTFSLFISQQNIGFYLFGISMIFLIFSLIFALSETLLSTHALMIEIK